MCGIVGYIGEKQAQPLLFACLKKLEYRGYDSCGIAVAQSAIEVCKDAVRVEALERAAGKLRGAMGVGHTRWATHGKPSRVNAHPHLDCSGKIAVVHNGIISNFQALRSRLQAEGHTFVSETDTEVLPHLVEKHYRGDLEEAVTAALREVEGSYAIIVMISGEPRLVIARKDSPLIIGIGDREKFIASDVPAILGYTSRVVYVEDGDIASVSRDGVDIKQAGVQVKRAEQKVLWSLEEAQKGGYEHFMIKEIHEQPRVIRDTLSDYTRIPGRAEGLPALRQGSVESVLMTACGTSYHAALIGKHLFEELLGVPVRVELASELNYYSRTLVRTLGLAITQSGETADTLKAMKRLKEAGCHLVAVTNVVGSTATRLANQTIYTRAGPEISVAATKSFVAQLMVLYWLAMSYSNAEARRLAALLLELRQLPSKVQQVLDNKLDIVDYSKVLAGYEHAFLIGRGINYPVALEGSLKLKEIAYIHAEGYAAGETKHGPLALLGKDTPVVAMVGRDGTYEALVSNIKEIKARGAPVTALVEEGEDQISEIVDWVIKLPRVDALFAPVINTVALQLLAYYTARERHCPVDFPRNLAKSVTVE